MYDIVSVYKRLHVNQIICINMANELDSQIYN